jgi:trans-aconitate methyltransferase
MNIYLEKFVKETFPKQGKALDLGAGNFFDVASLRQMGWKSEGVDLKTGINLEKSFKSNKGPYDLVYSNYVVQKLINREQLFKTIHDKLKDGGWFFIHTFDASDKNSKSKLTSSLLKKELKKRGFTNIKTKVFSFYDNDFGHKHWHKILQATGKK